MNYIVPDIQIIILKDADIVRTSGKDIEWESGWDVESLGESFDEQFA